MQPARHSTCTSVLLIYIGHPQSRGSLRCELQHIAYLIRDTFQLEAYVGAGLGAIFSVCRGTLRTTLGRLKVAMFVRDRIYRAA